MTGIYMVVVSYYRKAGKDTIKLMTISKRQEKEIELNKKRYQLEVKRFLGVER